MGADNRLLVRDRLYKKHQAINMLRLCGVRRTCCANKQSVSEDIRASQYNILRHANTRLYQSSLILTELFQHNLINVSYLTACYLYQVMMTLHFSNDVANDAESTQK